MLKKLKELIGDYVDTDLDKINEGSTLRTEIGLSSFEMMSLIGEIEESFGVEIKDEDICEIVTVDDLIRYIKNKGEEGEVCEIA